MVALGLPSRRETPRGLTPPALALERASLPAKNYYYDAHTHTRPRAAGVSPPCVGEPNAVPRISRTVRRPRHAQTRAAGVSPPWAGKIASAYTPAIRRQTADGVCADCRCIRVYRRHGGLTPPALALQCERLAAKKRLLRCTYAHPTKSGGRQPAGVLQRQPSLRESDFLAGERSTVRSNRCRKSPASPMLDAVEMR